MDLIIRPALEADAAELRDYAARLFSEDLPGIFRRPTPTLDEELEFICARINPPNSTALVALVDGRIVGLLDVLGEALAETSHVGTLGISVDRQWRGRGIGGALLDAMVRWAQKHGVARIQAAVWENNPRALALYERHGFVREGVCRRAVIRDGRSIDTILIARVLDA